MRTIQTSSMRFAIIRAPSVRRRASFRNTTCTQPDGCAPLEPRAAALSCVPTRPAALLITSHFSEDSYRARMSK